MCKSRLTKTKRAILRLTTKYGGADLDGDIVIYKNRVWYVHVLLNKVIPLNDLLKNVNALRNSSLVVDLDRHIGSHKKMIL